MALPNIFSKEVAESIIGRINQLTPATAPLWGTMNAGRMLAHANVSYEMIYENKHPKPGFFMKLILKLMVKKSVVNEVPYRHSERTAPAFIIQEDKNFEAERQRLIDFIRKTQQLGESYFEGKASHSFGPLNKTEWNNMLYKHLDHHLRQFGV